MPGNTQLTSLHIYLPEELRDAIDAARGETSRNRWVVEALAREVGRPELADQLREPGRPKNQPDGE